jgi:hypothetical protein
MNNKIRFGESNTGVRAVSGDGRSERWGPGYIDDLCARKKVEHRCRARCASRAGVAVDLLAVGS